MPAGELVEKIALFYYFAFLDEVRAQSTTVQTIKNIRKESLKKKLSNAKFSAADIVRMTNQMADKVKKTSGPTTLSFSASYIVLPPNSNWGPWFEFKKVASEKDFRAVLLSKILNFSENEIAEGLDVSVGTIRYRIGRGLKTLGAICHNLGGANG
jgi:Sigma-70, region 4